MKIRKENKLPGVTFKTFLDKSLVTDQGKQKEKKAC